MTVPTPRSYVSALADMVDAFTSRKGIANLRIGSPILSILEAAAQSDVRSSQDIFSFLNSISLDRAEGNALDRIGADEDLQRRTETFSSAIVDVGDSSFSKISTKIYVGVSAPIIGSGTIYVTDASSFSNTGQIYLGRGTSNYEGPLSYTAKTNLGTYWSFTLAGGSETVNFHNHNESIVLAQGGNRTVPAGSVIQTAQGNVSSAISFNTLYSATIPDGEVSITGVQAVSQRPGLDGNVPRNAITSFTSAPFLGAIVTNPLPVTNALAGEDDKSYRERIRNTRQSKAKGTPLAIETATLGATSTDESKTVLSASVVTRQGYPTTLYIDDGTGYEEKTQAVAIESIVGDAQGGERYFQLNQQPIAKAFVETTLQEPFSLVSGSKLAILVGGVEYKHTFSVDEFRDITNATAYEVSASVNGDPDSTFGARISGTGTKVSFFATADTQESVEVTSASIGEIDAKSLLGLGTGETDTLLLYKNDLLLSKDGKLASLTSFSQGLWSAALTASSTLLIDVDGTGTATYTFTAQDFIDGLTGYGVLSSSNSLDSWITVLNNKIVGVTATKVGSSIVLTSNRGNSSSASITIVSGTLVSEGMWAAGTSTGQTSDYTLDRNLSQLRLNSVLAAGDKLATGTTHTRAFVESGAIPTTNLTAIAQQWWAVDGQAEVILTSLNPGDFIDVDDSGVAAAWGDRIMYKAGSGTPFSSVLVGDWVVIYDAAIDATNQGVFRVAYVTADRFDIERPTAPAWTVQIGAALTTAGIKFVRSNSQLQHVSIGIANNYTAASLADEITADLRGAVAEVYRTNRIRVRTDSYGSLGDIALVAQNTEAEKLMMTPGSHISNLTSHLGVVESGNSEIGTTEFVFGTIDTVTSTTVFDRTATVPVVATDTGHHVVFKYPLPDAAGSGRVSNLDFHTPIVTISGTTFTTKTPAIKELLVGDGFYAASPYATGPEDELAVLVDEDEQTQRYVLPMWRRLTATTSSYGITNKFKDTDNTGASLVSAFGSLHDFVDYSVWMKARTKTHSGPDTTSTMLYRYFRYGPEGDYAKLKYTYPSLASQVLAVTTDAITDGNVNISVSLPSGAARTGVTVRNSTKVGVLATGAVANVPRTLTYILGYDITSAVRVVKLNYTQAAGGGVPPNFTVGRVVTGFSSGAFGTIGFNLDSGTSGTLTLTGVVGVFIDGEALTDPPGGVGVAVGSQHGVTTLTLNTVAPAATIVAHGFGMNDVLYVNSTDVNFVSGLRVVSAFGATTITYTDVTNTAQAATPNIGNVSYDIGEAKLTGSTVIVGDISSVNSSSSLTSAYETAGRVTSLGAQYWNVLANTSTAATTTPVWCALNQSSYLSFFPLDAAASTITGIETSVNALAAVTNSNCPVTAVALGTLGVKTGVITKATYDELNDITSNYSFADGINWVKTQAVGADYEFTFKNSVTASLATNSDWAAEIVRLVPTTAKNTVDYMNSQGVSGLSSVATVDYSASGDKVQISTDTPGSAGGVRVQGGTGNSTSAPVVGSASTVSTYMMATCQAADATGLRGGQWVDIQNTFTMPKQIFGATTKIENVSVAGLVELSVTNAWTYANTAAASIDGFIWQIEKVGRYTAFRWDGLVGPPDLAGIKIGDWVIISGAANTVNQGQFRVVNISDTLKTFYIENSNSTEERVSVDLSFYAYDSIMPGDTFIVNSDILGSASIGSWTVIGPMNVSNLKFSIDVTNAAPALFAGPVTLTTTYSLFQVYESAASKLVKKIRTISPNADGRYVDIKFDGAEGYRQVSSSAGSLIQSLDKLDFPTDLFQGVDGYRYSTGLIREVNKIAYGDPSDTSTYPGVVAAGAKVNIQGPLVKKITCALALRLKSGVNTVDTIDRAKSAVAAVVNKAGVGDSIAIVDLAAAAQSVNGVSAVTVLSPTYSAGNDLISVQPFEKPMVLDVDADIQISLVSD